MKTKKLLLLLIGLICSYIIQAQVPCPELMPRINGMDSPDLEKKIEQILFSQEKKQPGRKYDLKLWAFYVYDSLGLSGKADTLAIELQKFNITPKFPCQAKIFFRLGNLKNEKNIFEEGIKLYYKGLKISRRLSDQGSIAMFYKSIGATYLKLEQNQTAEKHLRESFRIYSSLKDSTGMANASISLGNALKDQGDLAGAEKYYTKSLELAMKLNNKRLIAGNYNNLGNLERRRKNYEKALRYFFKALEMNKLSGNRLWESFNYNNISNTYADLENYNKAIEFLKESNKIKVEIGDSLTLITGYLGLSDAYASIKNFKEAYHFLRLHNRLKDTLGLIDQANMLKELEAQFESEKQAIEIERLKTAEKLKDQINSGLEVEARNNLNLAVLAILAGILLLGGVAVLYRSNASRKRANELLNSKKEEIESSNGALQIALSELSERNKEIIDSINYATYIQRATLPNISQHTSDAIQFELFFSPKDIVSGDFYFSYQFYNRSIFGVADCTGHGVPGAMVSLVGMNSLEKVVREEKHHSTAHMLESLNKHVVESLYRGSDTLNDGMDISFCRLDHENNMLHFTGANHTAYVLRQNSFIEDVVFDSSVHLKGRTDSYTLLSLSGTRRPIGKSHTTEPFTEVRLKLLKGDRIVLFSDGYADQIGGDRSKKLKKGALLEFILRSAELPLFDQAGFMRNQFDQWKGNHEQVDDVCMLFVEIKK